MNLNIRGGISLKAAIVYKSKTGFTRRYAEWIQEEAGFDLLCYDDITKSSLEEYDLIIFGSRIHAGKLDGLKKFQTLLKDPEKVKLVVFATGGTPLEAEEMVKAIWKASLTPEELETLPHFYFPAGLNYERMGTGDKLIMKTLARFLSKRSDKTAVEAGTEKAIGSSYDITSKEHITPLLKYIESLS